MGFLDRLKSIVVGKRRPKRRVVMLGADGMDPRHFETLLKEGRMPNMQAVLERGNYSRMQTTTPAESPVAWSSFATGTNPGKHGIFDFLTRNAADYTPAVAPVSVKQKKLGKPEPICNRQGTTFWKILGDAGLRSTIIRVPVSFPPEKFNGRMLSGLGVPDLRGTWGTSVLYTESAENATTEFGGVVTKITRGDDGHFETDIYGPKRADGPVKMRIIITDGRAVLEWQGENIKLAPGKWSGWVPIQFEVSLGPVKVRPKGIMKFYLHSIDPVKLYLSAISLDPADPFYAVSQPAIWSKQLVEKHGNFCTLGWMEDTWGLNEDRISEAAFLEEAEDMTERLERIVFDVIEEESDDFMIAVFEATDRNQHMFWRYIDPEHPAYTQPGAKEYGNTIFSTYERFDQTVGEVAKRLDRNDVFMVMSDHGFNTFRREVNINTWLRNEGYLVADPDACRDDMTMGDLQHDGTFWPGVDWSKTRAYSMGLGKIYLNLKGRESQGCVNPGMEFEKIRDEIIEKFYKAVDPLTGEPYVSILHKADHIFSGPMVEHAGDIVVGFHMGYRVSWQTALGGFPPEVVADNKKKWSADHCSVNSEFAKGVLCSTENYKGFEVEGGPSIMDLAPTILRLLDVDVPKDMDGIPLQDKE